MQKNPSAGSAALEKHVFDLPHSSLQTPKTLPQVSALCYFYKILKH